MSLILSLFLAAASATATIPPSDPIAQAIHSINADSKITSIRPSPLPGIKEVIADGTVIYVSDDGRYLMHGTLLDMQRKVNLTDLAGAVIRKDTLDKIPTSQRIVFAPAGKPKYRVTVFTDVSCHFCQELHKHLSEYLAKGVEVDYVAYPREGTESEAYPQMVAVWCSKDRKDAFNKAIAGQPVTVSTCQAPVMAQYKIGESLGINGTPAVFSDSGMQLGGLISADELVETLDSESGASSAPAPIASAAAVSAKDAP
jgi:thiol:disulfide interchange protein DsbC